jgi:hypothetical protein
MRREGGAWRTGLLAPDLLTVGLEDFLALDAQQRDLIFGKAVCPITDRSYGCPG